MQINTQQDTSHFEYKYLIIGNSKTAKHFSHYFNLLGIKYDRWTRKTNTIEELDTYLQDSVITHIIVLIPDRYIEDFINKYLYSSQKIILHFSGCLTLENAVGVHPLCTFGPELYSLEEYKKVHFIVEKNLLSFGKLLPGLPNQNHTINIDDKVLYHALCVISGNFTSILWSKVISDFESKFNIPKSALMPYMDKIIDNLKQDHKSCLTGPLARKDKSVIGQHLSSLKNDDFVNIYKAFVEYYEYN